MNLRNTVVIAFSVFALATIVPAMAQDPICSDPTLDGQNPPSMHEITVESGGAKLNAIIYQAQGNQSRPTVVFLHGYPGNERNLDLAQAVRRAGFNAVYFNYRGSWGSGGTFSWANAVEDASAVVRFLRSAEAKKRYYVDPDQVILVGHSVGGWVALMSAASDSKIACVASLAGYNLGRAGELMRQDEKMKSNLIDYFVETTDPGSGPIRAAGAQALADQLTNDPGALDVALRASALRDRSVLLVSGAKDSVAKTAEHHDPLVKALQSAGASRLRTVVYENGDHAFSAYRIALARAIVQWIQTNCVH